MLEHHCYRTKNFEWEYQDRIKRTQTPRAVRSQVEGRHFRHYSTIFSPSQQFGQRFDFALVKRTL